MNKTAQRIITATSTASIAFYLAMPAFAQNNSIDICPGGSFSPLCNKNFTATGLVGFVINILFIAAVVLSLIFLIWGGIQWILSAGDKAKVESARNTIVGALIGLAITFAAYFLINIVMTIFLGTGLTNFTLPTLNSVTK
jgi:hypothetical protein